MSAPEETKGALLLALVFFPDHGRGLHDLARQDFSLPEEARLRNLPFAYLVTAVLMSFVASSTPASCRSMNRRRYVSVSLDFFHRQPGSSGSSSRSPERDLDRLWLWSDVFLATSVTQFWILVYDFYQPRQAKRFVGFFVSGGLLGGIAGSLLVTFPRAKVVGTENLLLVCAVSCSRRLGSFSRVAQAPAGGMNRKGGRRAPRLPKVGYLRRAFKSWLKSRYLVLLSGVMLAAFIVSTIIDFQFSAVIKAASGRNADDADGFPRHVFHVLLIVSYFFNVLLTNRILGSSGCKRRLFISPVVLAVGVVRRFLCPGGLEALLGWATIARRGQEPVPYPQPVDAGDPLYPGLPRDEVQGQGLHRPLRQQARRRPGRGLVLMVCYSLSGSPFPQLSLLTLGFILVWAILNLRLIARIRRHRQEEPDHQMAGRRQVRLRPDRRRRDEARLRHARKQAAAAPSSTP